MRADFAIVTRNDARKIGSEAWVTLRELRCNGRKATDLRLELHKMNA